MTRMRVLARKMFWKTDMDIEDRNGLVKDLDMSTVVDGAAD